MLKLGQIHFIDEDHSSCNQIGSCIQVLLQFCAALDEGFRLVRGIEGVHEDLHEVSIDGRHSTRLVDEVGVVGQEIDSQLESVQIFHFVRETRRVVYRDVVENEDSCSWWFKRMVEDDLVALL